MANQLKIQTPKTYWSEKNKTTTLTFTTGTELNTFKQQIQVNTFGNQAQYYLPTLKNSVTHTQVIRETNVVAIGVNSDIDVSDIESELSGDGIDFTRVTRIRNSQWNTHLIRIFSKNSDTIKSLLTQGISKVNRRYKVVPPKEETHHTPCRRCKQYGHEQVQCSNDPKCFKCGSQNNKCTHTTLEARASYCATCDSPDHYTGQMKCPRYPRDTPPPSITKHTSLVTQHRPLRQRNPANTQEKISLVSRKTHTHTHTYTHTRARAHTHRVTPTTYAAKIPKSPQTPDIDLAIQVLQIQTKQYIN